MAFASRRPLPDLPGNPMGVYEYGQRSPISSADIYSPSSPLYSPAAAWGIPPLFSPRVAEEYDAPRSTLPGGTILHKGFYDLLALATPAASRFFGVGQTASQLTAGPRYEQISPGTPPAVVPSARSPMAANTPTPPGAPTPLKKGRRVTKDLISRPTGFVHLVHASDHEQAEALLTRWGPDRVGKLGDPRWAAPIKSLVRSTVQARAIAEVIDAQRPSVDSQEPTITGPPLRVVNGMPTPSTTTVTSGTTIRLASPVNSPTADNPGVSGAPSAWPATQSKLGLPSPQEDEEDDDEQESLNPHGSLDPWAIRRAAATTQPQRPRKITPSLPTLEKAVAARIYFENLYFPLLRQQPSREQRRIAMEKEMEQLGMAESQRAVIRERWRRNETEYLRERRAKVDVNAFIKLKTIGHGAFGVVSLVKEKHTNQLYAMKQLRKTDMLRKGQEGHVRAERDVLKGAALVGNPNGAEWIVRLFYSFQDQDHLYLVLEFMGGGDLLNLLIEKDVFEEDFTRFYIAEMILAIEQCHKQGFIHRDIKPDNFLFDPNGHIKLSDFGLATDLHWAHDTSYYEQQRRDLLHKHGIDLEDGNTDGNKTRKMNRKDLEKIMGDGQGGVFTWREKNRKKLAYSVCGTNSYMSPEVIRGQGYTFSCDWWSLGVIMFECLYGYPPFVSNSRHVTRQKILNWKSSLRFPSRPKVSHDGVDLMQQLLCEPEDRLGSQATSSVNRPNSLIASTRKSGFLSWANGAVAGNSVDGAEFIKSHPWFRGIDWDNIHKAEAPFKPDLKNPEDTKHFDSDIPAEPLAPANGAPADATRDPMLKHKVHGEEILEVRKALAFAGFTHRSPRPITYARVDKVLDLGVDITSKEKEKGRGTVRSRAMSM